MVQVGFSLPNSSMSLKQVAQFLGIRFRNENLGMVGGFTYTASPRYAAKLKSVSKGAA